MDGELSIQVLVRLLMLLLDDDESMFFYIHRFFI